MISDLHLHTRLSRDAVQDADNNVAGFVKAAAEKGISYIAITEHRDIMPDDPKHEGIINADLDECARQIDAEKKRLLAQGRSGVTLLHGVELAHAHMLSDEATQIIAAHDYDFILGSLHLLKDKYDFYRCDFDELSDDDVKALFLKYLEELYEIAAFCDFDSFAHCTYPLRYIYRGNRLVDMCKNPVNYFKNEFADIFKKLIEREKALEVNTSGVKFGEFTNPDYDLLKLFKELGGKYVTTGSDSHDKNIVGSGIEVAEAMIKELGFDGVTVYVGRQPRIIPFNQ